MASAFSWSDMPSLMKDFFHASRLDTSATLSETTLMLHTTAGLGGSAAQAAVESAKIVDKARAVFDRSIRRLLNEVIDGATNRGRGYCPASSETLPAVRKV